MTLSGECHPTRGGLLTAAWLILIPWTAQLRAADGGQDGTPGTRPEEILAVVTEVVGAASAETPAGSVPVRVYQLVRDGTSILLGPGARITIACEGGVIRIEESGPVSAERCRQAGKTRAGDLVPYRGRVHLWNGSPVLEGGTRTRDAYSGTRPVLVKPRCPNEMSFELGCVRLREPPAEVAWTEVEGVSRYGVTLEGFETVEVMDPDCDVRWPCGFRVCSFPWPEEWRIRPGEPLFLQVTARTGLFDSASSGKTKIEFLEAGEAAAIREDVAAIRELGLDPPTLRLALASFFAERELYNDTVSVLEEAVREESDPVSHLALADAYVKVAWLEAASLRYRHVLDHLDPEDRRAPELRAAAELGLGWVSYLDDRLTPALEHFRASEALAEQAGLTRLAEQAREMIRRIWER